MWFLLKHSWKMISVMNTSALSTVSVLVLLQLVWSVFGAILWAALWSPLELQFLICCRHAVGTWASKWQIPGQLCPGQSSLPLLRPLTHAMRGTKAVLIGVFTAGASGCVRGIVREGDTVVEDMAGVSLA